MLDVQVRALLEQMAGAKDYADMSISEIRESVDQLGALGGEPEEVREVVDLVADGPAGAIPVRVYKAFGVEPSPVVVYYHGGGFVAGGLESHDRPCRSLVNASGASVVSVDYRLAPEHKFPAAIDDCFAALCWVADNASSFGGDASRLAVAGDSGGGNIAAVIAQLARDHDGPALLHQLLVYPGVDHFADFESHKENAEGYLLSSKSAEVLADYYVQPTDDRGDPRLSPLRAADLSRLPSATVVTAEHDPLRDHGKAYADALAAAGVDVEYQLNPGMIHGFWQMMGVVDATRVAYTAAGARLRDALKV